jgi:RNA recognition motif. (a.k.a. RRM, RBD, or RNP domain)
MIETLSSMFTDDLAAHRCECMRDYGQPASMALCQCGLRANHLSLLQVLIKSCAQAIKVLNMVKLFGKPIRVNKASQDKKTLDVGANLFVGNLDPDVDEKMLYDTFSAFGVIVNTPKIMRDPDTGACRAACVESSRQLKRSTTAP